jgi:ATPase subunit of ABC transporter with duplicated ATPase domains
LLIVVGVLGSVFFIFDSFQVYLGTYVCASHDPGIVEGVATHVYEVKDLAVRELLHMRKG